MSEMTKQNFASDTVTLMEKYNFHKPMNVSIIYEDHEEEPNRSKVMDYGANNFNSTNLQENSHNMNHTMQQQYSYFTNKQTESTESSYYNFHRFYMNGNGRSSDGSQTYSRSNSIGTSDFLKNPNMKAKKDKYSNLRNQHKNKFVFINKVTKILASIKEASIYYRDVIGRCKDDKHKNQFRDDWLRVKHNLFNRCLTISKDYLLQYGDNNQLVKELVSKIENIVKTPITYNLISNLHDDLLKWIKLKKFQVTNVSEDQSKNNVIQTQNSSLNEEHPYLNFSRENTTSTKPSNVFSSRSIGRPVPEGDDQNGNVHNVLHSPTAYSSSNQEHNRANMYDIPPTNHCFSDKINQQYKHSTVQNVHMLPKSLCTNPHLENLYGACYINTNSNQASTQDFNRSSISRDSGFSSPVTSVLPSEHYYNATQIASSQYGQFASSFHVPAPCQNMSPYE